MSSALVAAYKKAPIILWVEDYTTRAYLQAVWHNDPKIHMLDAGGWPNVAAVVNDARRQGVTHVFGLRDRDFGSTNRPFWSSATATVFVCEAHEVENFLLADDAALAACTLNTAKMSASTIRERMHQSATNLSWWMAARCVVQEIYERAYAEFISHPSRAKVTSEATAVDAVLDQRWTKQVAPHVPALVEPAKIRNRILTEHARYADMLATEDWRREYSGKEILTDLVTGLWTIRPPSARGTMFSDFAAAVGQAQVKLHKVPPELYELQSALHSRILVK